MADLVYPTLDLFLYDLRNGLGETDAEVESNQSQFTQKLPSEIHHCIAQQDRYFEAEYQELLFPERFLPFESTREGYPIEGYYYPVRLNDAYGLLMDASVNNQEEPHSVSCFKLLTAELESRLQGQKATVGQTWMLSGWLPDGNTKSGEETTQLFQNKALATAQACYDAFLPEGNWKQDLEGKGRLLGAHMFELWRYRSILQEGTATTAVLQSLQQNLHVVILVFPDQVAAQNAASLYDDWLRLFSFRNKILWAYSQSRVIKQLIKTDFTMVQSRQRGTQSFDDFRDILAQIQDTLNHYKLNLIQLDFQGRTIDINLSNYKKRLQRIMMEGGQDTDLAFLKEFSEVVENKYLLQITKDSENMELGLRLLEDAINATQSRLEVEKAEQNLNFQRLIKYWGTGLAAAAVVPQYIDTKKDPLNLQRGIEATLPEYITCFIDMKEVIPMVYMLLFAIFFSLIVGISTSIWSVSCRFWKEQHRSK